MNKASSRLRAVAIAAATATAVVFGWGALAPGVAHAQYNNDAMTQCANQLTRKDRRLKRARTRAQNYKAAYEQLRAAMLRMEQVASSRVTDYRAQRRLLRIGARARATAASYVGGGYNTAPPPPTAPVVVAPPPTVVTPPAPPPPPAGPPQITWRNFRRFKGQVRRASFDRDRVALVRGMARTVAFTSSQVAELMRLCSFDRSRVDVGAALYPNVVDRQNWYVVYSTLSFSTSKKKLRWRTRGR